MRNYKIHILLIREMPVQILAKILAILHENSTAFSVPPDKYHDGIPNGPRPPPS
jgi:hypothetical protein